MEIRHMHLSKKDLLLVNAGGTASQERQLDLTLVRLKADEILNRIHPDILRNRTADAVDLWPAVNSSNITSREHLQPLSESLASWRPQYRSMVVVMGTNTAAYVGSFVSFALGRNWDVPIVFISGQRHQGRMGSESMENIDNGSRIALEAADLRVREIGIYSGRKGQCLLRAVGAEKASDNDFLIYQSTNIPPLAELTAHETRFSKICRRKMPEGPFELKKDFTLEGIIPLRVLPDFDPNYLEAIAGINGCRAMILESFETGNLPDYLLKAVGRVVKQGVNVVVVPQHNEPNLTYKMPKEEQNAVMAGAVAAPSNITKSALSAKIGFWLGYNQTALGGNDLGKFLDQDFVGEIPDRDDIATS